jgi:hypothetical protein
MEQIKEIRIILTEDTFTQLCKIGFLKHQSPTIGRCDIQFYKHDITSLTKGEIVTKEIDTEVFKFILQDIGIDNIREIIKRSPIYYELSNQI